jgi:hypothetical protein
MRVVAVDWSGKFKRAEEFLWLAGVRDGQLVDLRSGLSRPELVARLIEMARDDARMVVGLDFAFSFPRWWCVEQGWSTGREVWSAMQSEGEHLLAVCELPLWGRPGRPNPHSKEQLLRRTDLEDGLRGAKSVFQIGGAGAVAVRDRWCAGSRRDLSTGSVWPGEQGQGGPPGTRSCSTGFQGSDGISSNARPAPRTRSMRRYRPS